MSTQSVFRLLHITDPHLHAHADSRMRGVVTFDTFRAVVAHAMSNARKPDAILVTGDLVQDETRSGYERFHEALAKFELPVLCVPGNHDAPLTMAEVLNDDLFQVNGTYTRGKWAIVLLNTFEAGQDSGRLGAGELDRLRESLAEQDDRHALICLHHHPVPMGSRWLDGVGLADAEDFLDIVDQAQNVRGIVWGHVHQASDRHRDGILLMSSPSTCAQFRPNSDHFAIDARPPGFRWLNLRGNGSIDTEVVWLP